MKVNNINGTSDNACSCGSWLKHWVKFSKNPVPTYCPATTCMQKPEVGAHVQKDSSTDKSWYIIPLCQKCNKETGKSLSISDIVLVPANKRVTCEKVPAIGAPS